MGVGIFFLGINKAKKEINDFFYLALESNAEITLKVDKDDKVIEAIGTNEEGKILLSDLKINKMTLDEGLKLVLENLDSVGYLENKEISIYAMDEKEKELEDKQKSVQTTLEKHLKTMKKNITVVSEIKEEVKTEAKKLKISDGKMLLINEAVELNASLKKEDLANKSIEEIYVEIKEYKSTDTNYEEEKERLIQEIKNHMENKNGIIEKFKVTFVFDNGLKDSIVEVEKGKSVSKLENPKKTGYKFLGWYLDTLVFDFNRLIDKDIILKAKWEKEAVTQPIPNTTNTNNNDNQVVPNPSTQNTTLENCFTYVEGTTGLTITGYKDTCSKSVTIPSTIDNKSVVAIGESAFDKKSITSVVIPNTITNIGKYAFLRNSINTLVIPSSVTRIEWGAFNNCNIYTLTLNEGIKYIGTSAFSSNYISSLHLPTSLEGMGNSTFANNKLTSIIIPSNIKGLGSGAFENNEISNLEIRSGAVFSTDAFNNNKLPDDQAFIYKRNSGGSIDNTTIVSYGGINKGSIVIPNGVKTIGESAFGAMGFNEISLPVGLENIHNYAFSSNNLTNVVIPNTVKNIGWGAFYNNKLSNITIPNSVTNIGDHAFNKNNLPDDQAFIYKRNSDGSIDNTTLVSYGGQNITNIIIPSNITTLVVRSFGYNNIPNITIPYTVKTIEKDAFYGNNSNINVTIKNTSSNVNVVSGAFPANAIINYQP